MNLTEQPQEKRTLCSICVAPDECQRPDKGKVYVGDTCLDFEQDIKLDQPPLCPHCGEPLTDITEYADIHQDFVWNDKTKQWEGEGDNVSGATRTCSKCSSELSGEEDQHFLDHAKPESSFDQDKLRAYAEIMEKIFGTTDTDKINEILDNMKSTFQAIREQAKQQP